MVRNKLSKTLVQSSTFSWPQGLAAPLPATYSLPEKALFFGTGVLLRGLPCYLVHQANQQGLFNGRVVLVKNTDHGDTQAFDSQDGLFTHVSQGLSGGQQHTQLLLNNSVSRVLNAHSQWADILALAAQPQLCLLATNTTEVGLTYAPEASLNHPDTIPGKITAVLHHRWAAGQPGLVLVPCELLPHNGQVLKQLVLRHAAEHSLPTAFVEWLNSECDWCDSLVDSIVTGRPAPAALQQWEAELGYADDLLITSETYRLWAIAGGERVREKLQLHLAGTEAVIQEDISIYGERKLRILNGSHTISVGLAYLCGLRTVLDAMHDPVVGQFIEQVALKEIVPATQVPRAMADTFAQQVLDRYRNPFIVHQLINITLQYTGKVKMRCVPSLLHYLELNGSLPPLMCMGLAAYLAFVRPQQQEGDTYQGLLDGQPYPINDATLPQLLPHFQLLNAEEPFPFVQAVLGDASLWGQDLNQVPGLAQTVASHLSHFLQGSSHARNHVAHQLTHA